MSTQNRTGIPNSLHEHWMPFTSNKNFKNLTNVIHPGSFTHRSYAYCIISNLNKMNLLGQ